MCVDLEGALLRTDFGPERLLILARQRLASLLHLQSWWWHGRADVEIQKRARIGYDVVPFEPAVVDRLRDASQQGRSLLLLSSQAPEVADKIARGVGFANIGLANRTDLVARHDAARWDKSRFNKPWRELSHHVG